MIDRETVWSLCIDGFGGTAYARRVARRGWAGPLELLRFDDPARPGGPFDEFFARACDPAEALAALAAARPVAEHYLTALDDRPGLLEGYRRGGYRLSHSEQLMARALSDPPAPPDAPVLLARDPDQAAWLNAHDPQGLAWIQPDNLADPRTAHYALIADGRPAARGRCQQLDRAHGYVSRVYTAEAYRRRGLGRALMRRILADEHARGARWSVLSASAQGVGLYAGLGYHSLGTLHVLVPDVPGPG